MKFFIDQNSVPIPVLRCRKSDPGQYNLRQASAITGWSPDLLHSIHGFASRVCAFIEANGLLMSDIELVDDGDLGFVIQIRRRPGAPFGIRNPD